MSKENSEEIEPNAEQVQGSAEQNPESEPNPESSAQDEAPASAADGGSADGNEGEGEGVGEENELASGSSAETEIEALNEQLAAAKDQALRTAAEMQNIRRRADIDVENAHKFALSKICEDLLPVVDNLERAQASADAESEAVKPLLEGVELTHKSFIEVLEKFKVERLDPVGEPFDPEFHQAMTMVESPDSEPNTVLEVMQKGYVLNGRLIRPAMVVVSKA